MTELRHETREVFNQSTPFEDVDLFMTDRPLVDAVAANGGKDAIAELSEFGRHWGSAAMAQRGRLANENTPKLKLFDSRGYRRDEVEFHPAYHELMAHSAHAGIHNSTWNEKGEAAGGASEVLRAAKFFIAAQVETGHLCPITMTRAAVGALSTDPALRAKVMPVLGKRSYDPAFAPWWDKRGMTMGMGMTEKQGGTDVRANITRAVRDGDAYRITGHKWFMSAPMCDAFLVLAQAEGGLTCFFMPRFAPDGSINGIHFQRLKDKLGNRSNASSEVEFDNAYALRLGEEGRGIPTIIQMVSLTRQDCATASAGLMRSGLAHALHHARQRSVFQKHLADQPLMKSVLADMALHVETSTALVMRLCRSFDRAPSDKAEAAYMRLLTPVVKYWTCKSAPGFLYEAMECMGGNGYVEEGILARHYRESPVNAIWEGSGNVMCLDVLRALSREGEAAITVLLDLAALTRDLPGAAEAVAFIAKTFREPDVERVARRAVEKLALVAATAALNEISPKHAELFAVTRLAEDHGSMYGAVDLADADIRGLLDRALPA
ncbi:DNA alkylation response protein [Afipia sp. Root123D2]|uniref:acyl-CoA dehydrogenase family protein n=1 Tax=Afipia sp. Root123D2 TaxID=1736436 RepID=UPI0006F21871|nr:acyl-CoA dehydrogenase family protein [Afipia sp. Root123D2]KQW22742.1 DNA alkylation response protein [Afipia sp. Root123D2]